MNRADALVIVLLLSMIAGFLAVPFTQWLCETIESAFDFVCELFRRKPKPKPLGPCDVLGTRGALWTMFGIGAAGLIKTLQSKETK